MNLFEGVDHARLEAIARDLIDLNSDVLPDEMIEEFTGSEADCLRIIETCYHSADCDIFAAVCEQITGDRPYTVRVGMSHHTVLSLSDHDGPFYDITGMLTLEDIIKRYGWTRYRKHVQVVEGMLDWLDADDDWTPAMVTDIIRYLKLIGRQPFTAFPLN
jgi:hypothetical protein